MRTAAFYTLAKIRPLSPVRLVVPEKMLAFLDYIFGDRLDLTSNSDSIDIAVSGLGLRHLLAPSIVGKRFVLPYATVVIRDRKTNSWKQKINKFSLKFFDRLGMIQVPSVRVLDEYQGYMELVAFRRFRDLKPIEYYNQAAKDFFVIRERGLLNGMPLSSELSIPTDLPKSIVVFPSGTTRTFMPAWWAKQQLPNAIYAFFNGDPDINEYKLAGLSTTLFHREPGDIIELARSAKHAVATDSFCSHLLQQFIPRTTILLTELVRSRIVSPNFAGSVVAATAPCHPCLRAVRGPNTTCQAGFKECLNWTNTDYAQNLRMSVPK